MLQQGLGIAAAILLVRFVAGEAAYERAKPSGAEMRFPLARGFRFAIRLGCPLLLFVSYKALDAPRNRLDGLASFLIAALAIYGLLAEPSEIIVTSDGLSQKSRLGLQTSRIGWKDAGVLYGPGASEVLVSGSDGTTITHTQYHVDRDAFVFQLQKHNVYKP